MLEELDDLDLPHDLPPERHPHKQRYRIDPITAITNPFLFKQRYRFSTDNVRAITEMVRPIFDINTMRGNPCTAEQIVCSSLETLAGGQFSVFVYVNVKND